MFNYFQPFVQPLPYDAWLGYLYSPLCGGTYFSSEILDRKLKKAEKSGIYSERW